MVLAALGFPVRKRSHSKKVAQAWLHTARHAAGRVVVLDQGLRRFGFKAKL